MLLDVLSTTFTYNMPKLFKACCSVATCKSGLVLDLLAGDEFVPRRFLLILGAFALAVEMPRLELTSEKRSS